MQERRLIFSNHALVRMFRRGVTMPEVLEALAKGQVTEEYPDDEPYPSRLVVGWSGGRCLHVVAADNEEGQTIVITVYDPDPRLWEPPDFTRRRPRP